MNRGTRNSLKISGTLARGAAALCLLSISWIGQSSAQDSPQKEPSREDKSMGVTLSELEQMALSSHPALAQAAAGIRAAEGRKQQAGLYPNPTVGYQGEQIRGGIQGGGEQGFFVAQDIVLGGKLGLNRQVAEQDRKLAEVDAESQRQVVLNRVRISYYHALASQQMVELRGKLSGLAQDAVTTTQQLGNVGQADQPDLLQAEVESDEAELAMVEAEQNQKRAWTELATAVGRPAMPMQHLAGDLMQLPQGTSDQWLRAILDQSPELEMIRISQAKAEAELARSRKQSVPDLQLRGGLEQNFETNETTGRPLGLQGFAEAGVRIPIFDRNQGNVSAARAEVERARLEVERVQLSLRQRAAAPIENYETAMAAVARYRDRMIPHAQQAYDLYRTRYHQMAAAYPHVLIAQRTLFQLQANYIIALETLWRNAVVLQGFLLTDSAMSGEMSVVRGNGR